MRGRGIDEARRGLAEAFAHGHRLFRSLIRQAEDDHIGLGHHCALGFHVLPLLRRDGDQPDGLLAFEPLADLQAGGAGLAINENGGVRPLERGPLGAGERGIGIGKGHGSELSARRSDEGEKEAGSIAPAGGRHGDQDQARRRAKA
jgi:hypothetical protein